MIQESLNFKEVKPFPAIGDWHTSNAIAFYGESVLKDTYKNDPHKFKNFYRSNAKAFGLAMCYGGTYKVFVDHMNAPEHEARRLHGDFFKHLSGFSKHLTIVLDNAKKNLYITNLFGRRIFVPQLDKKNDFKVQAAGMRTVYNYPIQSVSADLCKLIINECFKLAESAETNRYAGDILNDESIYQRIVSIEEDQLSDELVERLETLESGNVLLLVKSKNGDVVQEFDRPLRLPLEWINEYSMKIEW